MPCEAVAGGDKPVWNAGLNDDIASTEAGFKYRVGFFSRVSTRRAKHLEQLVERERLCANDAIAPTGKRSNRSGFFVFKRIARESEFG